MMPDWIRNLLRDVKGNIPKDFVGQIEINIFKGAVSNVNVKQSFKESDDRS